MKMTRNEREVAVMSEYKYAFNKDDLYTGQCDSIEVALAEARQEAESYLERDKPYLVYIGRYKPFEPMVDADGLSRCCNVRRTMSRMMWRKVIWIILRGQRSNRWAST